MPAAEQLALQSGVSDVAHSASPATAIDRLAPAYGGAGALNLDLHLDLDGPEVSLAELDQLASHCRECFLDPHEGNFVFTSSERLDGKTGTADLIVVGGVGSYRLQAQQAGLDSHS